jgi:hypothetical protein
VAGGGDLRQLGGGWSRTQFLAKIGTKRGFYPPRSGG